MIRKIPIPTKAEGKLAVVSKESGLSVADGILEFCRIPRSSREICDFLGKATIVYVNRSYLQPLVDSGRLRLTVPNYKSNMQRFVNAENAGLIPTVEAILDFCKEPRTKTDIARHFGMSYFVAAKHYDPLIESGALVGDTPWHIKNRWQKFLAAGVEFEYKNEKRVYKVVKKP